MILLICLSGLLPAQQIISTTTQKVDFRIPYRPSGGEAFVSGNSILREMAKDVLREPWLVQIRITCELGLAVIQDDEQHKLIISLIDPGVDGDTVYRRFPVGDVLFPSQITMKLRWANRADTSGFVEETLTLRSISRADSMICSLAVASFNPMVDTLMVRETEFFYDSLALLTFIERLDLIHDYYASVLLLDSLQKFTTDLPLDIAGLLPYHYLKVEELSSVIRRIDSRDFEGRLLRNAFDPAGLMRKYQQMFRHSRSLVFNFIDETHKIGAIPWDVDADRLASYITSRVLSYIQRSFLMDQQQGRIFDDCLEHFFDQSAFPPEKNIGAVLLAKMYPDARQDTTMQYVSRRIYASYRTAAQNLMDQNQYAAAFSMMENGHRFIIENPFLSGTIPDEVIQSKAAEGIWNSYIGIASTCISNHNYHLAETYLSKADQYALSHEKYIRSDSSYQAVFSRLFFLRNADCDQLLNQKRYAEALDCYHQFENAYPACNLARINTVLEEKKSMARLGLGNLSANLSKDALKRKEPDTALYYYEQARALREETTVTETGAVNLDSLAPVMAGIKFRQLFQEGATALEKRQYTLAVTLLKEGKSLAEKYRIDRNREFDSIYRRSMKYYLIVNLSAAQKKIWANHFDSAKAALRRTETAGFSLGLGGDPDFMAALEHYKGKIREQQCRNLTDSVDLRMIRAGRNIMLRNFVNALVNFQEALSFSSGMPECDIADTPIRDTLSKYGAAAAYQQKLANIRANVASGNYTDAVIELDENMQAFQNHQLERLGIRIENIFDFIQARNNPYLTEKAISFYFARNEFRETLRYLLLARSQGLPAKNVSKFQEQLGLNFAQADYLKEPKNEPELVLANHIPADDWFNIFRKTFITAWNRLVKAGQKD